MTRINLLPHRQEWRRQRRAAFAMLLALGGALGLVLVLLLAVGNAAALARQAERNALLGGAIAGLDKKIAAITALRREIIGLEERQRAVEQLQEDRNAPVYLMEALARQTPAGIYLKSVRQEGRKVTLLGYAQSQERVSEMLRDLAGGASWLERPDLLEVKSALLEPDKGKGGVARKVVEFHIEAHLRRQAAPAAALVAGALPGKPGDD